MSLKYLTASLAAALALAGCETTGAAATPPVSTGADTAERIAVPEVDAAPAFKANLDPATGATSAAGTGTDTSANAIPLEVEYQFLRLTQMMAERMDRAHLDDITAYASPIPTEKVDIETLASAIDVTADQTALIAAPEDVVAGGAYLLQTGVEQRAWIDNRVNNLLVAQPGLATYDLSLMEEAVLVRWGVLDGLQSIRQRDGGSGNGDIDAIIARFEGDTLRLHDDFQFAAFEQDIDSLSEDALEELEATLEAFTLNSQRDLDDNSALAAVRRYEDLTNAAKREANLRLQRRLAQAALLALVIFAN